jgi:hypothetical protein
MKEVEIENRTFVEEDDSCLMVDLIIDGEKIETGEEPISSYSFWSDMEDQAQRALYRIKKNNPEISFNFNWQTMGMSDEQLEQGFREHIKNKYKNIDVDKVFNILDKEIASIEITGPDDNHPNPFMKFPIGSHMTREVIIKIVNEFVKEKNEQVG